MFVTISELNRKKLVKENNYVKKHTDARTCQKRFSSSLAVKKSIIKNSF